MFIGVRQRDLWDRQNRKYQRGKMEKGEREERGMGMESVFFPVCDVQTGEAQRDSIIL